MLSFRLTVRLVSIVLALLGGAPYGAALPLRRCVSAAPGRAGGVAGAQIIPTLLGLTPVVVVAPCKARYMVTRLLGGKPDLAARDQEGWTALTYASANGNSTIVKTLISRGADVNSKDNHGATPLMQAATYGYVAVAKHLISKGADVNAKDDRGR